MCLAIPMRVLSVDGLTACCEAKGVIREVQLIRLLGIDVAAGDHLAVQGAEAVARMSAEEARDAWVLYDQLLTRADDREFGSGPMA